MTSESDGTRDLNSPSPAPATAVTEALEEALQLLNVVILSGTTITEGAGGPTETRTPLAKRAKTVWSRLAALASAQPAHREPVAWTSDEQIEQLRVMGRCTVYGKTHGGTGGHLKFPHTFYAAPPPDREEIEAAAREKAIEEAVAAVQGADEAVEALRVVSRVLHKELDALAPGQCLVGASSTNAISYLLTEVDRAIDARSALASEKKP